MAGLLSRLAVLARQVPKNTEPNNPMIAFHNTTLDGLIAADDIGGIPMPSVAITRADAPMENFGDISLVMRPDQVNPARGVNVFAADGYTGRQDQGFRAFVDRNQALENVKADPNFGQFINDFSSTDFNNLDDMLRVAQYGQQNKIGDPKDFANVREYAQYVRNTSERLGRGDYKKTNYPGLAAYGDVKRFLRPNDPYTPGGNPRSPIQLTLPEVMKRMRSDRAYTAGSEGHSGPGLLRAISAEQFKNMRAIKSNRDLLIPGNKMGDIQANWDAYTRNLLVNLSNDHFRGHLEKAKSVLQDVGMGRSVSWANLTDEQNAAVRAATYDLRDKAKRLPTEYFEAKPKRVVELSDIDAAVVPESLPEASEILNRSGVRNIQTYRPSSRDNTERNQIMSGLKDFLFGVPIAATGGILSTVESNNRRGQQ